MTAPLVQAFRFLHFLSNVFGALKIELWVYHVLSLAWNALHILTYLVLMANWLGRNVIIHPSNQSKLIHLVDNRIGMHPHSLAPEPIHPSLTSQHCQSTVFLENHQGLLFACRTLSHLLEPGRLLKVDPQTALSFPLCNLVFCIEFVLRTNTHDPFKTVPSAWCLRYCWLVPSYPIIYGIVLILT